jgi:hypothetical protein
LKRTTTKRFGANLNEISDVSVNFNAGADDGLKPLQQPPPIDKQRQLSEK